MVRLFYSEYGIENIARRVLTAYDARLYYGQPSAIPIEDLIEANGLSLEYQYLRKNGRILGKRQSMIWSAMNILCSQCGQARSWWMRPSVKKMPARDDSALPAPMSWHTGVSIKSSIWALERVRR